jgi:flagellar basal body P-ring formation protein FlgA
MTRSPRTLLLAALACLAAASATAEPRLRHSAVVEGGVIRLGDLFTQAGARADDVVSPAPPPGSRTIFDAAWLAAAAAEHGLVWQPASHFDLAVIERATRTISADAIAARLLDEIGAHQSIEGAEIQLDNATLRLQVGAEAPDGIAVEALNLDARSGRFTAYVVAPAGAADAQRQRLTGRLIRTADLPVLNRPLAPGDTIAPQDIETLRLRTERVGADIVVDLRELIGKTPRRPLRAHEPLSTGDVQVPVVIHRGDLVTIVLETATMRLTAQGKALDDGGQNATIRIANTKSNRVVDAIVVGPNTVTVGALAQLATR